MTGAALNIGNKYALHKVVKLRHRKMLTRSNRLRLRYAALYMAMGFGVLAAVVSSGNSSDEFVQPPQGQLQEAAYMEVVPDEVTLSSADVTQALQSQISDSIRRASAMIKKTEKPAARLLKIGDGDTLGGVLESAGISGTDAHYAIQAMSKFYDPRLIKAGQTLKVDFKTARVDGSAEPVQTFDKLSVKISPIKEVVVAKNDANEFSAQVHEEALTKRNYAFKAEIETSLYGSALKAGIPAPVVAEMIRLYSWNVDFQRDIRQGDKIEIMYEAMVSEDGNFSEPGNILFANLAVGGKDTPIYRFEMADGTVDYFEPDGHSIKKTLMKTPIDGARLSSGFGMRHHPVLGYDKMHKGLDFAAPTGTPIYAAGDGTIENIGRNGAYGNYIRIRHNSTLKTAYAHMSKYAKNLTKGTRVKQGDIIGYVGTTGRSTGPHLHYEVLVENVQKNPRSVDLPTGEQLKDKQLASFNNMMNTLKNQYAGLSSGVKVAKASRVQ